MKQSTGAVHVSRYTELDLTSITASFYLKAALSAIIKRTGLASLSESRNFHPNTRWKAKLVSAEIPRRISPGLKFAALIGKHTVIGLWE